MAEESAASWPALVLIARVSAAGPFARGTLPVRPVRVPTRATEAGVSAVVGEESGVLAAGALAARVDGATVEISGRVPARPGKYAARLDLGAAGVTPIRVNVAASAAWGVGCMLVGLLLLGVLNLLTGEGGVQERAREVYRARADIHAAWDRDPPPQSAAGAMGEIDGDFDTAMGALAQPRALSVVDRRLADAAEALAAGRAAAAKLREAMDKLPAGGGEVANLSGEWTDLQARLRGLTGPPPPVAGASDGLAAHAASLLGRARIGLVGLPLRLVEVDLGDQLDRVRLAQAAGETDRARAMSIATRAWMRRAAGELERRLNVMAGLKLLGERLVLEDAWVRRLAGGEWLAAEQRAALLARLDAADATLAAGDTLQDLETANQSIDDTVTEAMRDQAVALLAHVKVAGDAAGDELSTEPMDTVMNAARQVAHPTIAQKAEAFGAMLEVWRGRLHFVHDEAARRRMTIEIDAAGAAAARQDLAAMLPHLHALQNEWRTYLPRHIAAGVAKVVEPVCRDERDRVLQDLEGAQGEAKLQSDRPDVADWDSRLDRARRALLGTALTDADCIGAINVANGDVIAVSQAQFTRMLNDTPIPLQARLDAAEHSGVAAAVALVRQLQTAPRELRLKPSTDRKDWVSGQPIFFRFDNFDQSWGPGVSVTLDWGDHEPPLVTDGQRVNHDQSQRLEHIYRQVATVHPVAVARDGAAEVGRSSTEIFIKPSPASAAERLADIFLTAQFGLALLIASVVYYWRFHAGDLVFGASGFHYVQAFALGFAAYAAVADLPKILAELPFK
jgi:hypothetical protein